MAKMYQINSGKRMGNRAAGWMIDLNLAPASYYLLTVPGRKSGKPHTTPVILVEQSGVRWLVAPYGDVNWVLNAGCGKSHAVAAAQSASFSHRRSRSRDSGACAQGLPPKRQSRAVILRLPARCTAGRLHR